jgi:primosomal protein N' (replication factor Y)
VPCPLERVKDQYRFHLLYFTQNVTRLMPELMRLRAEFPAMDEAITDVLDVDALDIV